MDNSHDAVNKPAHYTDGKIEVIDFIEDKKLGFHLGNAVKYISRAGKKDPAKTVEDLQKAKWYLEREIKRLGGVEPVEDPDIAGRYSPDVGEWKTDKKALIDIIKDLTPQYFTDLILSKSELIRKVSYSKEVKFKYIRYPYESRKSLVIKWTDEDQEEFKYSRNFT